MPTPSSPLKPDDDRRRTIAWIQSRSAGDFACSLCGRDEWTVAQPLGLAQVGTDGRTTEKGVKFMPVVCNHCGNTLFINAESANL